MAQSQEMQQQYSWILPDQCLDQTWINWIPIDQKHISSFKEKEQNLKTLHEAFGAGEGL